MNSKKLLMAGMLSLSLICSGGVLVGCSNTSKTTTTETSTEKTERKTIGEKTEDSKSLKLINKTGKEITVFETKSSSDEAYSENLLTDGDVIKKNENRILYYLTKDEDTLSIKIGLKSSDSTFTFDKVDETEKIKNVEINVNDEEKVELTVNKKDDSKITISATADEVKSENEKENEEKVDETAKTEESDSDSKADKTSSSSSTSKSENKTSTTTTSSSSSNKNNSSNNSSNSSSKNESTHTHDWVAQTKVVHHDEVGHNEQVLVKEAYDEQVAVVHDFCNTCNIDLTANGISASAHAKEHMLNGENGGHHSGVVYNVVHHEAQYTTKYVVDTPAYDETVITGYKCSKCGATK